MKARFFKDGCPPEYNRDSSEGAKKVLAPIQRRFQKIERNKPCPCGTGVKYKKCCADIYTLSKKMNEIREDK